MTHVLATPIRATVRTLCGSVVVLAVALLVLPAVLAPAVVMAQQDGGDCGGECTGKKSDPSGIAGANLEQPDGQDPEGGKRGHRDRRRGRSGGRAAGDPAARWQRLDKDGDGALSAAEWPGRKAAFQRIDRNGDGKVTREEMKQAREERRKRRAMRRAELDKDGDGRISRAEFPGDDQQFRRRDQNGDGYLDRNDRPDKKRAGRGKGERRRKPGGRGEAL